MKTAELTGPLLDAWVAKALGLEPRVDDDERGVAIVGGVPAEYEMDGPVYDRFSPSQWWAQGGQIIERVKIGVEYGPHNCLEPWDGALPPWHAYIQLENGSRVFNFGPTPLIAAMRAKVASKFGEEVPDTP